MECVRCGKETNQKYYSFGMKSDVDSPVEEYISIDYKMFIKDANGFKYIADDRSPTLCKDCLFEFSSWWRMKK